jgi:hypothetical protein
MGIPRATQPETIAHIEAQPMTSHPGWSEWSCGCTRHQDTWELCQFHDGYDSYLSSARGAP